jgi:hypothetical protein
MKLTDEPGMRKYLQSVLEADDYHVDVVSNRKDAISIYWAWILPKANFPGGLKNTAADQGEVKKIPHTSRVVAKCGE